MAIYWYWWQIHVGPSALYKLSSKTWAGSKLALVQRNTYFLNWSNRHKYSIYNFRLFFLKKIWKINHPWLAKYVPTLNKDYLTWRVTLCVSVYISAYIWYIILRWRKIASHVRICKIHLFTSTWQNAPTTWKETNKIQYKCSSNENMFRIWKTDISHGWVNSWWPWRYT